MAQRTVTALFDRYEQAADAVRRLEAAGIGHDSVSIVSNQTSYTDGSGPIDDTRTDAGTGAGVGASIGTLVGGGAGLLAGLGLIAIPGLGPVVAAGWLAATLLGAGVGAAAGGIVGGLTQAGVSETDARAYAEGIRRGGTLVTVRTDDTMVDRVRSILDVEGTVDMTERQSAWRNDGWTGGLASDAPIGGSATAFGTGIGSPIPPIAGTAGPLDQEARLADEERLRKTDIDLDRPSRDRVRVYPMDPSI